MECGGLTPLFLRFTDTNQSGVKPPHSKTEWNSRTPLPTN